MRKKLIAITMVCVIIFVLAGCTDYNNADTEKKIGYGAGYFTTVKSWRDGNHSYEIMYANDTKVMYFADNSSHSGGVSPLYNADGTLQIYNEE